MYERNQILSEKRKSFLQKNKFNIGFIRYTGKHYRNHAVKLRHTGLFFKVLRFICACMILTAFLIIFALGEGFFDKSDEIQDFNYYDSFIWPVVMQNPSPFDEKNPPECSVIIGASIWNCAMDNKFNKDKFNEEGMLVLSENEVRSNAEKLFGENISFKSCDCFSGSFYKYNPTKKEFIVVPKSGTSGYLPHTVRAFKKNGDIFLKVGYVLPQNQFNCEMNKVEKNKVEKFARYKLKKSVQTGNLYISSVI